MKKLEVKYLDKYFDVKRLIEEKEYIESRLKYEDGAFFLHCISLPNIFQIKTHTSIIIIYPMVIYLILVHI